MAFKKWHSSLKFKLFASTISMTLVISAMNSYLLLERSKEQRIKDMKNFAEEGRNIGDAISAQFFERYADVQTFSLNPALLDSSPENKTAIASVFDEYIQHSDIYDFILFVDTHGKVIASNQAGHDGKPLNLDALQNLNFENAAWFKNSMSGIFTEDKSKGFLGTYFEDAAIDEVSSAVYGTPMYGSSFSTTVKDANGQIVGVLTNRTNFKWVEKQFEIAKPRISHDGFGSVNFNLINGHNQLLVDFDKGDKIERDLGKLLKSDLANTREGLAIKYIKDSAHDYGIVTDHNQGQELVATYYHIRNEKFIDSINWNIILNNDADEFFADEIRTEKTLFIIQAISTLVFALLAWIFSSRMSKTFMQVAERLGQTAELTQKTSVQLTTTSRSVSESSTEQSAAVQETVSSMSEISSMIAQTNLNVKECTQIASRVTGRSEQGNQTMRRLASAMDAVNHANAQLQNMANIINEVSAKTMVINDIVFKTQLLSINASIEAARAGQHGKGFSVVAEEVGNLAQMSGNAAKEIQLLISDSQKQVLQIIEVTQSRSKESQSVSQEAVQAFSEIASGIVAINERLAGVTQATHEQEIGIQQISIAMTQMDQTTQRNSTLASDANELALDLGKQSDLSYRIVKAFRTLVVGSNALKNRRSTDIVDILMNEDSPHDQNENNSSSDQTKDSNQNLLSLVSRFEDKLNHSPAQRDVHAPDFDGDDASFKKPA